MFNQLSTRRIHQTVSSNSKVVIPNIGAAIYTVIPQSAAVTVCITRPNSKSVWTMLLRFGHVFGIIILAPDPPAHALNNVFRYSTHQKYDIVDDKKYQKIKDYASKE